MLKNAPFSINNTTITHSEPSIYAGDRLHPSRRLLSVPWSANQIRFAKARGSDVRPLNVIERKGKVYQVVKAQHSTQGRGGAIIQESERGAWHVPVTGEYNDESLRIWICIARPEICKVSDKFSEPAEARESRKMMNGNVTNKCCNSSVNSEISSITGKRKERSESPTK